VITIQATFTCQAAGAVTFVLTQSGGSPATSSSQPMTCGAGTGTTGGLTVTPATAQPGQQVSISGACQQGATLTANPPAGQFIGATINGQPAQPAGTGIACSAAGTLTAMYICSQPTAVTFTLGASTGTLSCGGAAANVQYPYGQQQQPYMPQQQYPINNQPTANLQPNAANAGTNNSPVSIQVSPSNVTCGSTATVSISARAQDGQAVNQGNVSLYTTTGAIEPKTGSITNGKFETKFTAPATPGTATISASVLGLNNSTDVKIDCTGGVPAASTTSSPSTATTNSLLNNPASPPPPPAAAPIISPPSTGDAGLKALLSD
jgi:hypothetical protein